MNLLLKIYRNLPGKKTVRLLLPSSIKKLAAHTLMLISNRAEWPLLLGGLYLQEGNKKLAAENLQKARKIIESPYILQRKGGYLQKMEFALNKKLYQMGEPMADDPLVESSCEEVIKENNHIFCAEGEFTLSFTYNGLKISGKVYGSRKSAIAEILLEGIVARKIPLHFEYGRAKFEYKIKRPALILFPEKTNIQIRLNDGTLLGYKNSKDSGYVEIPKGIGSLATHLETHGGLDKKGHLRKTRAEMESIQNTYLKIYEAVKDEFKETTGTDLFLLYGTLLGHYRDHEFIPGDDDFDVGYVSHKKTPTQVKEETRQFILDLVNKGYTVIINKRGKPFRLRHEGIASHLHLDARPVWEQEGKVWAHKQACLKLDLKGFSEVEEQQLKGVPVVIPAATEAFLRAYYGKGWRTPDPSFSNASVKVDPYVKQNIKSSCFTAKELSEILATVEDAKKKNKSVGSFYAAGIHSLYPLNKYETNCGW